MSRTFDESRGDRTVDEPSFAVVRRVYELASAAEARVYLESVPDLWAKTSDAGRHTLGRRPNGSTSWG